MFDIVIPNKWQTKRPRGPPPWPYFNLKGWAYMESLAIALVLGFFAIQVLRLPRNKLVDTTVIRWFGFLIAVAVTLGIKIYYFSSMMMVASCVGMLFGFIWSPVYKEPIKADWQFVAAGSLLVMDPLLSIVVIGVLLGRRPLRRYYSLVFGMIVIVSVIVTYYLDKSDIIALFLLGYYLADVTGERLLQSDKKVMVRKIAYLTTPMLIFTMLFLNRYVYHGFGMQRDLFREGPGVFKVVALTFDDGPNLVYTPAILDILKEKEVPATFFMVGRHVEQHPEIAKRIVAEGHEVGSHTYSHANLLGASGIKVMQEIIRGQTAIEEVTGERPKYFRPPRGLYSIETLEVIENEELSLILWSVSSQDWLGGRWRDIVRNVIKGVEPGAILLFHDSGDFITAQGGERMNTVKALPVIIDTLREEGYSFISVRDMLILSGLAGEETDADVEGQLYE